jgi:hypothetical protein
VILTLLSWALHIYSNGAPARHTMDVQRKLFFFFPTDSQSFVDVLFLFLLLLLVLILLFRWVEGFFGSPRLFSFFPSFFFFYFSFLEIYTVDLE